MCYIFRKQLEEAKIIVINKADVVPPERMARLREVLAQECPEAEIMALSSREGTEMEPLFDSLAEGKAKPHRIMEVDYEHYGKSEALLGW